MDDIENWLRFSENLEKSFSRFSSIAFRDGPNGPSDVQLLGFALLGRTASNFKASVILVRSGMLVEARTMARSCLENSFYLAALVEEGAKLVGLMYEAEIGGRHRRGQYFLDQRGTLAPADVREDLRNFLKRSRDANAKLRSIGPKDVASKGEFESTYLGRVDGFDTDKSTSETDEG